MDSVIPAPTLRILHLEDSLADHRLVVRALDAAGLDYQIQQVDSLDSFVLTVETDAIDLILADYWLGNFSAMDAWAGLVGKPMSVPFVLVSGAIGETAAVAAIQVGISDFVHKDDLKQLGRVVLRALELHRARQDHLRASQELEQSERRLSEFASHLQSAVEHERAAIAREIHDDIGGCLAAAKLDLAWLARHVEGESTQAHLSAAQEMLQHALGASQRIMLNLRPSVLDQGLVPAVQWLANSFAQRTGVATTVQTNRDPLILPNSLELTAFRTVQEALTNASKYAQCTQVRIDLSDAEHHLTVEITDNGIGMNANATEKTHSFGIRGLRERARTVGGWLDVSSLPGRGTAVILSVPLRPETPLEPTEHTE